MEVADTVTSDQALRQLLSDWESALRARDLDRMMSFYTPDVVFYDGIGPLQMGQELYRKNWDEFFSYFPGPVEWRTQHMKVTAGDRAAFSRALVELKGTNAEGKCEATWMRQTVGYEKIGEAWRISHEHWSMPMDMETGKVATTLTPE
jgi:uncharacterized protein (TIGR02246 family)